jgi:hypothetical protein
MGNRYRTEVSWRRTLEYGTVGFHFSEEFRNSDLSRQSAFCGNECGFVDDAGDTRGSAVDVAM